MALNKSVPAAVVLISGDQITEEELWQDVNWYRVESSCSPKDSNKNLTPMLSTHHIQWFRWIGHFLWTINPRFLVPTGSLGENNISKYSILWESFTIYFAEKRVAGSLGPEGWKYNNEFCRRYTLTAERCQAQDNKTASLCEGIAQFVALWEPCTLGL